MSCGVGAANAGKERAAQGSHHHYTHHHHTPAGLCVRHSTRLWRVEGRDAACLLYTSPSPRDAHES
eukprot:5019992-Prymnesium_polylepis.1